ncbi:MAG: HYR domain-containing protein [Vicinamibacterales bacterium]
MSREIDVQLTRFRRLRSSLCLVFVGVATVLLASPLLAQGVPGRNITLIGPTPQPAACTTAPFCGGKLPDTGLKQQNEPSCAISPETGGILCGANDYRGTDRADGVLGDAWLGAMMSRNRETWTSRLIPGFKGDTPSLNLAFGADPSVAAFPGGMGFLFIAGNRGDNALGGIFFQRWVEMNKEDGYPFEPANEPTHQITSGTSGRFIDKPALMINLLPGSCDIPFKRANGTAGTRSVPKFEVSVAFAVFLGSDTSSNTAIWLIKSSDCGMTWDAPGTKVTQTVNINQGVSLASIGNTFVATWRRFGDSNSTDAVMASVSTNRGAKWSLTPVSSIVKFDQPSSNVTFRNNSLPWLAADGTAFHVFWTERTPGNNLPRIKVSSSRTGGSWNAPSFVDNVPVGFQAVPSATASEGIVQVAWYDTRDDLTPFQGPLIGGLPFVNDYVDAAGKLHRHTIDVRAAQGTWNGSKLDFTPSVKVSSYQVGLAPPGFFGTNPGPVLTQLENNFANSRIFQQGKTPFLGDYIAVAAKQLKLDPATRAWVPNTTAVGAKPTFFIAWGDNRLLRGNTIADLIAPTGYTPPTLAAPSDGVNDPAATYPSCSAATPLSNTRNQEVFGTSIRPGLIVSVPSAPKPTGTIQRAYVVWVRNTTSQTRTYKVHIANQPVDAPPAGNSGRASFVQLPLPPYSAASAPPVLDACVTVPRRSGAVKTVFVASSSIQPPAISVQVSESDPATCAPLANGDAATVILNSNPLSPDIENPDFENPDFENFNLKSVELHNPDIENKTFAAVIGNPDIENPDFENYTLAYPDIENPDFENPDFENISLQYPDIENPDFENPDFENPDFENSAISELTWSVKMNGNTTTGLQVNPLFSVAPPHATQLIVRRVYKVTTSQNCKPVQIAVNEVIANAVSAPNVQPTVSVPAEPGETLLVTLRISGTTTFNPDAAGVVISAQAKNTGHENDPDVTPGICNTSDPTQFCTSDVPKDVTPPVFGSTPDVTIDAADGTSATVSFTATATDNVGVTSFACSPASGSTFSIGTTVVTCTATDGAGNTASITFNVIVKDVTAPVFGSTPDVTVNAAANASSATATYAPTATDAVGVTSLTCSPASGSTFPVGATAVTCTATDAAGNAGTATFNVIVRDVTAPVLIKPADLIAEATSAAGASVIYALPTGSDAVGIVSKSCTPASGAVFPLGSSVVSCTASDAAGNMAATSFSVVVRDTTAPVIGAVTNLTVNTTNGAGTAVVTYAAPSAVDAVGVSSVSCSPASGSTFPLGSTTVTCTARDASGNTSAKTFTVTVVFSAYGFIGPNMAALANVGSVVPMAWQYTLSGTVIDAGSFVPVTRIFKLTSCQNGTQTGPAFVDTAKPGSTTFNYKPSSSTWQFNWKALNPPFTPGCYNVYIDLTNAQNVLLQTNGPFKIQLK